MEQAAFRLSSFFEKPSDSRVNRFCKTRFVRLNRSTGSESDHEPHDGVPVDAQQPFGAADRVALDQMLPAGKLLFSGEAISHSEGSFFLGLRYD